MAAALDQRENGALASRAAPVLVNVGMALAMAGRLRVLLLAELGSADNLPVAANRREAAVAHGFAEPMRHEPCGLEGHAKDAVELVSSCPSDATIRYSV